MSHFSVFVIGDNVEEQLQPFHEFECTGTNDQYIQDIDKLQEYREEYEGDTAQRLKSSDGKLYEPWDHQFYRDPTPEEKDKVGMGSGCGNGLVWHSRDWGDGRGYRPKVKYIPDGFEQVDVPRKEVETFANYVEDYYGLPRLSETETPDLDDKHKYGWYRVNAAGDVIEIVDRTNPNAHWDWWVIGGRWSGFLKLKPGRAGVLGERGLMGSHRADGPDRADVALKGDIDIDGMRDADGLEASKRWQKAHDTLKLVACVPNWTPWVKIRESHQKIDEAREAYHAQPQVKALNEAFKESFLFDPDQFQCPREEYVQEARDRAICPYALVMDSKWYAKGEMGWWGMSSDKMEQVEWNRKINELIDDLPDDTKITVVDCHI